MAHRVIHRDVVKARARAYPTLGDSIDALWKTIEHLHRQGVDVGDVGRSALEQRQQVRHRYPKSTT